YLADTIRHRAAVADLCAGTRPSASPKPVSCGFKFSTCAVPTATIAWPSRKPHSKLTIRKKRLVVFSTEISWCAYGGLKLNAPNVISRSAEEADCTVLSTIRVARVAVSNLNMLAPLRTDAHGKATTSPSRRIEVSPNYCPGSRYGGRPKP